MADRYWRGGSGTWNASTTTNWSTTSGGSGGASVPTSSDDVYFNTNSGTGNYTVTVVTGNRSCLNLTVSNPSGGTVSFSATNTDHVIQVFGDVDIQAGNFAPYNGKIRPRAFSGGVGITVDVSIIPTINQGGSALEFSGSSDTSTFNVISNLTLSRARLVRGVVNFGSSTHSIVTFVNSDLTNPTTSNLVINLDTCTINNLRFLEVYGVATTLNPGTSTINAITSGNFVIGRASDPVATPITLHNFTQVGTASATNEIYNQVTFNNLTLSSTTTNGLQTLFFADSTISNLTITGVLSGQIRPFIQSNLQGTARTLTVTTATAVNHADFQDIIVAGGAAPISGTMLGDCGGNTGITFSASKNCFWNLLVGGAWAATAWAATSGGAVNNINFPLPQDTAVIENTGLNTNATITFRGGNFGGLDWSTRTNNFNVNSSTGSYRFYGGVSGGSALASSLLNITFSGGRTQVINITAANKIGGHVILKSPSAVLQLANNFTATGQCSFSSGTLDLAGFTSFYSIFTCEGSGNKTLDGNGGIINVTSTSGTPFQNNSSVLVTVSSTTTLDITVATISARFIRRGFASPNFNVNINPTSTSSGEIIIDPIPGTTFSCNNLTVGNNFAGQFSLDGNLTLTGNFSFSNNALITNRVANFLRTINVNPSTATTVTFDTKGKILGGLNVTVSGADITSEVDLLSSLTVSQTSFFFLGGQFRVDSGTFRSNSNNITCKTFNCGNGSGGLLRNINIGTSLVSFGNGVSSGTLTTFDMRDPNSTLTFAFASGAGLRSIAVTSVSIFEGGDETYPTLTIAGTSNTLELRGNNSFENIKNTVQPVGLRVTSGTNQTVSKFELSGTAGNLVTLDSTTASPHTLTCSTGLDIGVNFLNISNSTATGSLISTQWYAGANSTNSGGNTGWIFQNIPPPPKGQFFMVLLG